MENTLIREWLCLNPNCDRVLHTPFEGHYHRHELRGIRQFPYRRIITVGLKPLTIQGVI